jgi:hypothetical protein
MEASVAPEMGGRGIKLEDCVANDSIFCIGTVQCLDVTELAVCH